MIGWILAAQIAVVAQGPDTGAACVPMDIAIAARTDGTLAPRIAFPTAGPLQLLRSTITSRTEMTPSGVPSTITEAIFTVATAAAGRVTIAPFSVTAGARRGSSPALSVMVAPVSSPAPQVLVRASLDDGRGRDELDSLFVGQQVDYVVDVQLNEAARQRLRRNPTFFPPDMPAVLAYDLELPPPVARQGRRCFETLSYRRALFPLFAGAIEIPPAALTYALPVSTSFFSREESFELRTGSVRLRAVDPPVAGRPADFAGAVGQLTAAWRVATPTPRMGDPLVLTMRLEGSGNVKLLPRPTIQIPWAAVALGEERVQLDTSRSTVRGAKEFDWLLTPRRPGPQEIAPMRYPYFDPERAAYDVALTSRIGLDIASAALASADTAMPAPLDIRHTLRPEVAPPLPDRPFYWALLVLAPVPATIRRLRRRAAGRRAGPTAAQRLRAAASTRTASPALPRDVRRLYLDNLLERLPGLDPVTARTPLGRQLRRAGVTDASAAAAERLLEKLDRAAFSPTTHPDAALLAEVVEVMRAIDAEAVRARSDARRVVLGAVATLIVAASSAAALPDGVSRTFGEAVRLYVTGSHAPAARLFGRVAARAPRAADAWANYGTASWAAGDSARAAVGWQRALRLEPLDEQSRQHLSILQPALAIHARGYVPPVPLNALAASAALLWIASWLLLALPPARLLPAVRALGGGAITVSIALLLAALELRERLDARGLAVVGASSTILEAPVADATVTGSATVGEVALLGAREGRWVHVVVDSDRAGWMPADRMIALDERPSGPR